MRTRRQRRLLARRLRRDRVPYRLWRLYARDLAALDGLSAGERRRLRQLSGGFLRDKHFRGVQGLVVDDRMRLTIATLSCLPILELGLDCYAGWREIVVYPDTFLVEREELDEAGVVHHSQQELAGESADRGAMVLSWGDIIRDAARLGFDAALVIHECAHKIDARSGASDGCPPLHRGMDRQAWQHTFSDAYRRLCAGVDAGLETPLDPYAAHSPAEFFAVACEMFFTDPLALHAAEAAVYAQLRALFRQDPRSRVAALAP